jgi:hypothetical protein
MRLRGHAAAILGTLLLSATYIPAVLAGTGFCIRDPVSEIWEIKILTCNGTDCLLQLDLVDAPPRPAVGAANLQGPTWQFRWHTTFHGDVQGTLSYSCEIVTSGPNALSGLGMVQRIASPLNQVQHIEGTCFLNFCQAFPPPF